MNDLQYDKKYIRYMINDPDMGLNGIELDISLETRRVNISFRSYSFDRQNINFSLELGYSVNTGKYYFLDTKLYCAFNKNMENKFSDILEYLIQKNPLLKDFVIPRDRIVLHRFRRLFEQRNYICYSDYPSGAFILEGCPTKYISNLVCNCINGKILATDRSYHDILNVFECVEKNIEFLVDANYQDEEFVLTDDVTKMSMVINRYSISFDDNLMYTINKDLMEKEGISISSGGEKIIHEIISNWLDKEKKNESGTGKQ